MQRRKLPIGIQTFREIRKEGYYYLEEPGYSRQLVEQGKHYERWRQCEAEVRSRTSGGIALP